MVDELPSDSSDTGTAACAGPGDPEPGNGEPGDGEFSDEMHENLEGDIESDIDGDVDDDLSDDLDSDYGDDGDEDEDEEDTEDDVPLPVDDDDDDEEIHPGDVEADLEEILRDRIAAGDDDEDDEDDEESVAPVKQVASVAPPRSDEWTCSQCFLIVSVSQFGSRSSPLCPSGEDPCESMERVLSY